jgi:hypothetical protein
MLRRSTFVVAVLAAFCVHSAEAKRAWIVVPGFRYVLVDEASIRYQRPPLPARDQHTLRPPDTIADIKIDGRIYPDQKFWCLGAHVEFGDMRAGWLFLAWPPNPYPTSTRFPREAMDAVEHVVCGQSAPITELPERERRSLFLGEENADALFAVLERGSLSSSIQTRWPSRRLATERFGATRHVVNCDSTATRVCRSNVG